MEQKHTSCLEKLNQTDNSVGEVSFTHMLYCSTNERPFSRYFIQCIVLSRKYSARMRAALLCLWCYGDVWIWVHVGCKAVFLSVSKALNRQAVAHSYQAGFAFRQKCIKPQFPIKTLVRVKRVVLKQCFQIKHNYAVRLTGGRQGHIEGFIIWAQHWGRQYCSNQRGQTGH